jgi:hypothetical protein
LSILPDGSYEQVKSSVSAEEATRTAIALVRSIGGKLGTTKRVIITDSDDFINWEWKFGEGIVYPPELARKEV